MTFTRLLLVLVGLTVGSVSGWAAGKNDPEDLKACRTRQAELAPKVDAYQGEQRIKRLMEADLRRASREEIEGDGDECIEALDHAAKLLAGTF